MRVGRALLRRSAMQAGALLAALAVSAVGAGSLVTLLAVPAVATDRGVAALLADAEPTAGALRVDTALARDDADSQDARVRDAIASAVGDAPLDTVRAVRSEPVEALVGGAARQIVLGDQQRLAELSDLVDGAWPASADEVTIAEPAAEILGAHVGDVVVVAGRPHRIVGIWRARDTADPAWFSETLIASGRAGDAIGPLMVDEADLAGLEARPRVSWTLVPRGPDIDVAALDALAPVDARLRAATSGLASGTSFAVTVSGELGATVARARTAAEASLVLSDTAAVLVLVAAGLVLGLVARSIGQVRETEDRLLVARGLGRAHGLLLRLAEAAAVVGVGAALGIGVALVVCASAGADAGAAVPAGVAAGLAGVVVMTAASRSTARRERAVAETESVVPALAVAVAAGFAATTAAAVHASPLRTLVPSLVLLAGVLLLRLLLAPAMRVAERIAARGNGLLPVLPLRQLGRRPRAVASAFVVVALAAGAVAVAGFAAGAVSRDEAAAVRAAVGGDVRIGFGSVDTDPVSASAYAGLTGVTAATEVALVGVDAGSVATTLVIGADGFDTVTGVAPPPDAGSLAVRITPQLATRLGAAAGDEVPIAIPGVRERLTAVVAAVGSVPGIEGAGLLVARDALAGRLPADSPALTVDEVWLAAPAPEATAVEVRAATGRSATVLTPDGAGTAAATSVGVSATAIAAVLVVLVGVGGFAAASAALARMRRAEVLPLRALGVGSGAQARSRAVELLVTALAAAVAGALAGAAATAAAGVGSLAGADLLSGVPVLLAACLAVGVVGVAAAAAVSVARRSGPER